jgi:hypothetical protein
LQRPQFFIWDEKYDNDPRTVNQNQVLQADHPGGPDNDCIVGCGVVRRSTLRHWASDVDLGRGTVWNYSFSLVERSNNDPYSSTFLIGFGDTLLLGLFYRRFGLDHRDSAGCIPSGNQCRSDGLCLGILINSNDVTGCSALFSVVSLSWRTAGRKRADRVFVPSRGLIMPGLNLSFGVALGLCWRSLQSLLF